MIFVEKLKSSVGDLTSQLFVKKKDPAKLHCRVFLFRYFIDSYVNVKKYQTLQFDNEIK